MPEAAIAAAASRLPTNTAGHVSACSTGSANTSAAPTKPRSTVGAGPGESHAAYPRGRVRIRRQTAATPNARPPVNRSVARRLLVSWEKEADMPKRAGVVAAVLVALVVLVAWGGAAVAPRADEWRALVETGDRLAATGGTVATEAGALTARAAYLLAFHHAQDAVDVPRMLAAAARLERLGEADLARHAREVARSETTRR